MMGLDAFFRTEQVLLDCGGSEHLVTVREFTAIELRDFLRLLHRYYSTLNQGGFDPVREKLLQFILRDAPEVPVDQVTLDQAEQLLDLQDQVAALDDLFRAGSQTKVSRKIPRHVDEDEVHWLEMAVTVAQVHHAGSPLEILSFYPVRILVRLFKMAQRERWHQQIFAAQLHGGKSRNEPDWGLEESFTNGPGQTEEHYEQMKAAYTANKNTTDPEGRKFPGML